MSQRNRTDKKLRKAGRIVREATLEDLDIKMMEVVVALEDEKWRYRFLAAVWLILPGRKRDGSTRSEGQEDSS